MIKDRKLFFTIFCFSIILFCLNFFINQIYLLLGAKFYYLLVTGIEYTYFSLVIYLVLPKRKVKFFFGIVSVIFYGYLVWFYNYGDVNRIDSIPIAIESMILLVYIFLYYYILTQDSNPESSLYSYPSFWFVSGIVVYIAFSFYFNLLGEYLLAKDFNSLYVYSYFGDLIRNALFTVGIFKLTKTYVPKIEQDRSLPFHDFDIN